MKKNILVFVLACSFLMANAQRHPLRDTTRHWDTSFASVNEAVAKLIHAPVLTNPNQVHKITPHQQYCFDVMMEVEMKIGRVSLFAAVFINTTDGYVGYTKPSPGGAITVLFPDAEDFRFYVTSYKLENIYVYHNSRASHGNGIDHSVSTSNTEQIDYRDMNDLTAAPIQLKDERRSYVYGTMNARAYKRSNQPTLWFINFADNTIIFPASLQVQKFLGAFGVGLIQTDHGAYVLCEKTNGNMYTKITNIEGCHVCFDPAGFKTIEADFFANGTEKIRAEREKLDRDEADARRAPSCVSERMELINYRREILKVQEENLRKAQSGNLMQDRTAQKGMLDMLDYNANVHETILSTKISLCSAQKAMIDNPDRAAIYAAKISCLQSRLGPLMTAESQLRSIDSRYANSTNATDLVRSQSEKSQVYLQLMRTQTSDCTN